MDITKTLADLREYKAQLEEAITALEALARVRGAASSRTSSGYVRSQETRKRMAEAQRKRWAASQKTEQPLPKQSSKRIPKSK